MWFSLFTIVLAAAICLGVASFLMRQTMPHSK
jgi:hypothetical protein